jgi:putative endonuclease
MARARGIETRRKAYRAGRSAEAIAAWCLRLKGYRIVATGFKTPVGEIDLIARRGRTLVFVEVKVRPTKTQAADAITARQQARIARAADWFLKSRPNFAAFQCRFDAVLVVSRHLPTHVVGAWETGAQ